MTQNNSIYGELNYIPRWYALYTRCRHEKKVDLRLKEKGIASYVPLNTVYRRWSDRYKKVLVPLFSSYVFVFIALRDRLNVLQTDGAIGFVSFNGIPATIPEKQIIIIRQILEQKLNVEYIDSFTPGKQVRVLRGPLKGVEGKFVTIKNNNRLMITIDSITQAISVEIDYRDLELI